MGEMTARFFLLVFTALSILTEEEVIKRRTEEEKQEREREMNWRG